MSNFKRKRPRARARGGNRIGRWKAKALGERYNWLCNWPAWWDVVFHRRPHRRKATAVMRDVVLDKIDADNAIWPVGKKPHKYFW
jgi:hypothetical protein